MQQVAAGQGLAIGVQPTQAFPGHRREAAKLSFAGKAAGRRQVGAGALARMGEGQALAGAHLERTPGRQRLAVEAGAQVGAGDGQGAIVLAGQGEAAEADFHHRRVRAVAQHPVGPAHGYPVEGAALGHAQVAATEAALVLEEDEGRAGVDTQAHCGVSRGVSSPPRRMNSARSMGSKRTRSPACSRL
ncbi:hypothetical protein D3C81_1489520 [compost metagenome]